MPPASSASSARKKNLTRLMQNSVAVFDRLEAESGQAIDWRKAGSLSIASSAERLAEIRRSLTQAKGFGFEAYEVSAEEAKARFPWMTTEGVVGAAWIPSDGYIDPYSLTMAYAKAARAGGVTIREGVLVTGFEIDGAARQRRRDRPRHDRLRDRRQRRRHLGEARRRDGGRCDCGRRGRASIRGHREEARHDERDADLPRPRPHLLSEARRRRVRHRRLGEERASLLARRRAVRIRARAFPGELRALRADHARRGGAPAGAERDRHQDADQRADPGLRRWRAGDGACAGAARISSSPAASPPASPPRAAPARRWRTGSSTATPAWTSGRSTSAASRKHQANRQYLAARSSEAYGDYYSIHWPAAELQAARGARRSPLYDRAEARGAVYGSKAGWERPLWFDTRRGRRDRDAELRAEARLVRGGRARAQGGARARRALRPDLVLEVRGVRTRRVRRSARLRRERSRPADRRLRLHAALQRAGRHRSRPHHHAAGEKTASMS